MRIGVQKSGGHVGRGGVVSQNYNRVTSKETLVL